MTQKKMKQIKVFFDVQDFENLKKISKSQNLTMSEFIRNSTNLKIANAPKIKEKKIYKTINPKLLYELNKIGNNLNQIAKKLNTKNEFDRKLLLEIYQEIMELKNDN